MTPLIDTIPKNSVYKPFYKNPVANNTATNHSVSFKNTATSTVKKASLGGSLLGTLLYLFALAKATKKGDFKAIEMFKIPFDNMFHVMGLATSSVIGGLTAGLVFDKKENYLPKIKESVHQFLGNIVFPITIVGLAGQSIKKKHYSKLKEGVLSFGAAVAGVVTGVVGGNWTASKVNQNIFREADNRKLTVKDFGIHVDDLLSTAALTPVGKNLGIEKFIPVALPTIFLICGYEAGTKVKQSAS